MPLTLAYWNIRGLGQPARLMLSYVEADFVEKRYTTGDAPEFNRDEWFNEKYTLGLDFPNLPYLIDGDIKVTQSNAVYRYIARKYDLYGRSEKERVLCDVLADQVMDIRQGVFELVYLPKDKQEYEEKKKRYDQTVAAKFEPFEKFLGNKRWLVGDKITFPDFHFYEMLDQHMVMVPGCLDAFPKLREYHARFEALPTIKKYMESDKYIRRPINNKNGYFV